MIHYFTSSSHESLESVCDFVYMTLNVLFWILSIEALIDKIWCASRSETEAFLPIHNDTSTIDSRYNAFEQ